MKCRRKYFAKIMFMMKNLWLQENEKAGFMTNGQSKSKYFNKRLLLKAIWFTSLLSPSMKLTFS